MIPILPLLLAVPAVAFVCIPFLKEDENCKKVALASTLIGLLISLALLVLYVEGYGPSLSFSTPALFFQQVAFELTITPISLVLITMASIVLFVALLSGNHEKKGIKSSSALIVLFQVAAYGIFLSGNLLMFFIFWDIGIIALFFMLYLLGSPNRKAAAMKFLVYEVFASALLLFGILLLYIYLPGHNIEISQIASNAAQLPKNIQLLVFFSMLGAFITNMPLFPFHSWLPDAHAEASTQGSMVLSGVLTKFGAFGALILFGMLPIARTYATYVAVLAILSAIYAALVLLRQKDLKRIIAYSTIVEMGIILLGITTMSSIGTTGAVYAMLAHGITVALMFLVAGSIIYTFGERDIRVLKGIVDDAAPAVYSFLIGAFAITGLPLTADFIAELLIFIAAFGAFGIYGLLPILAILLLGGYLYFVIESMISRKSNANMINTIGIEEKIGYAVLLFFIFLFGILPSIVLSILKL